MQGKKNFTPKLFHCFQLSERVPADNFYRKLSAATDLNWLYKATNHLYGNTGNPGIDPVVFFKFLIVGYIENIISDRKLVEHCSMRMDILLFLGYDIDEPLPWHSTISRSRQLYEEDVFEQLFTLIVNQCIDKGLVAGHTQCIDSALIKANASLSSLTTVTPAQSIGDYINESNTCNKQSTDEATPQQKQIPDKVTVAHYRRNKNPKFSKTDIDARLSQKPNKPLQLNYLSSISVDTSHHVITHVQADHADSRDSTYLPDIFIKTKNRLANSGIQIQNIAADTNYSSGSNYRFFEKQKVTAFIPVHGQFKYKKEGFDYDELKDVFICSNNKLLTYKRSFTGTSGNWKKEYRSSSKDCSTCPLAKSCLPKNTRERKLETSLYHKQNTNAYELQHSSAGKYMRRLRSATVEPVFGQLINYTGLRKIPVKGKKGANKCMLMSAVAYNLKKLLRYITKKTNDAFAALQKTITTQASLALSNCILRFKLFLLYNLPFKKQFCNRHGCYA
jgi:transposase